MKVYHFSMGVGMYAAQLADGISSFMPSCVALNARDYQPLRSEHPQFFRESKARVISIAHVPSWNPLKIWYALKPVLQMLFTRTTVLHIQLTGTYLENLITFKLAKALGITIVGTVHDATFHPGDGMKLKQVRRHIQTIELCDMFIVHGETIKTQLCSNLGIDPDMVVVIPHGSYDIYLKQQEVQENDGRPPQILLFGRMKKYKGIEVFIRAAQIVHEKLPHVEFVLAGRGEELDLHLPQLKKTPYFRIYSERISDAQVARLFHAAEIIAIPYLEASQSGPLNLAFSFGKATVASRVGAIPEVLTDQQEGILVEPGNAEQLAQAFIELLSDHTKRIAMGLAARKKAEGPLNWGGAIATQTIHVYQTAEKVKHNKHSFKNCSSSERWNKVLQYYKTRND